MYILVLIYFKFFIITHHSHSGRYIGSKQNHLQYSHTSKWLSLDHLYSFRSTSYDGTMKFRPSTLLLTNHRTADQSNVMSLVEKSHAGVCLYVGLAEGT